MRKASRTDGVPPYKLSALDRVYSAVAGWIGRTKGWDKLTPYLGALTLGGLRITLRRDNLADTNIYRSTERKVPVAHGDRYLVARMPDGTFNDLQVPTMGSANTRFGRNVPNKHTHVDESKVLVPNPRTVSRELMTRDEFIPATIINMLAAAWLQFMVHDWLQHGKNQKHNRWRVDLADDDPFPKHPMEIPKTRRDPTRPEGDHQQPPTFQNIVSCWWDASQLYGSDEATEHKVRSGVGGKLNVEKNGLLPVDTKTGIEITGVSGNWWVGLDLMHTLFTLEHNAICDRLHSEYPSWSDQELFDRARLVLAALLAKIHTVEWTPAILLNPTLRIALRANWWGLAEERIHNLLGRISSSELISGIPGSATDHFGVPYSITEEFVAVYRMHPLIRDDYQFRQIKNDHRIGDAMGFQDLAFANTRPVMERIPMEDLLYTFGTINPGAVTLHNFPRAMQELRELDGTINDLAAIDIVRVRERGVPRYNEFRRLLHKPPLRSFEQLSNKPEWVEQIRSVYNGDLDAVDLMVGLYAEPAPVGFGFSDTAFRIFILMASRRLNSDRFFTTDFTPEVYSPVGMKWIDDNGFASVLLRHFPNLRPALRGVDNPFAPWGPAK